MSSLLQIAYEPASVSITDQSLYFYVCFFVFETLFVQENRCFSIISFIRYTQE